MKRRKVWALLMTAVMTFSSVAPDAAIFARAEDEITEAAGGEEEDIFGEAAADASGEQSEDASVEETDPESGYRDFPDGIKGMPDGYQLTEQEKRIKENAAGHDVPAELSACTEGVDYTEDVVFFLADDESYAETVAEAYGARLQSFDGYVAVLDLSDSGLSVAEAVAIGAEPEYNIPAVEPDYIISLEENGMPADDDGADSYRRREFRNTESGWVEELEKLAHPDPYLFPDDINYQWWHDQIGTYGAWGAYGSDFSDSGITVAVIDTGVNTAHEDLTGHVDADGKDLNGHGSNVAGIIGATAGNGKGGAGVAPGIRLIGYTCGTDKDGHLNTTKIVSSVKAAADAGADIINMSLGGPMYNANFVEAINYAYAKEVTIIAAIGNQSSNSIHYPACYDHVISVAAVQPDGSLTAFSNTGDMTVDIAAPGVDMMSCNAGGASDYVKMQGTSQASPVVAGACAVYMSVAGHVTPDEMRAVLLENATPTKAKGDGCGIVNVAAMLDGDTTGPVLSVRDTSGNMVKVENGGSGTAVITADAVVTLMAGNYNANEKANVNTQLFYTVDGKAPSFSKEGEAAGDTLCCTDGYIPVAEETIGADAYSGGKYVIKAQAVTGLGVSSRVTTLNLVVNPGEDTGLKIRALDHLAAGGSAGLKAELTRTSGTAVGTRLIDKGVSWSITGGEDLAVIDAGTGVIRVNSGASGKVTVKAVYGTYEATTVIPVGNAPAKTITTDVNEVILSYYGNSELYGSTATKKVSITGVTDTEGNDITNAAYLSYSWTSSDRSVVDCVFEAPGKNVTLIARGKGNATVTGVANDGSGATVTIKVKVLRLVTAIEVSGQNSIACGASAPYKAEVYTKEADTKTVVWSVSPVTEGVSINEKGVVSVASTVAAGTSFYVTATAADGSGVTDEKRVRVVSAKTTGITLITRASDPAYKIKDDKKGSLSSIQLFTVNATSGYADESVIEVEAGLDNDAVPVWSSSNEEIVEIESKGKTAVLYARGKGKAKITCEASDGSGKKAAFAVNVIVPVAGIQLSNPVIKTYADQHGEEYTCSYLGVGKKTKTKATAIESYGKAGNTKVSWTLEPVYLSVNKYKDAYTYEEMDPETRNMALKEKLVSGKNGKVSFHKNYFKMVAKYSGTVGILLTATATDGTGVSASRLYIPLYATTKVKVLGSSTLSVTASATYTAHREIAFDWTGDNRTDFEVKSSNPSVATGYYNDNSGDPAVVVSWGSKRGTAVLTIKAMDGSNKKCKLKVIVR